MQGPRALAGRVLAALGCALLLGASAPVPATEAAGEARLLRYPDIHADFVVFVHAGDIWRVPAAGGTARRLTSHPGQELFPKISPDGASIAFSAEYTGSRQVYVMPAEGGPSRQLTFYNDVGTLPPRGGHDNWILGFDPQGKILVRMNRTPWGPRQGRYFLVDPAGGLEVPLELPEGGAASFSPEGTRLAYCPISREFRTWKRTRGGQAQDIWLYDLAAHSSTRLTDSRNNESFPMWAGDTLYFTSDAGGTLNLRARQLDDGTERELTHFEKFDVLWPSLGPDAIVFTSGGLLYRLDLATSLVQPIPVRLASDLPQTAPHFQDVREQIDSASLSPSGSRVVFEARGELFSVPAEEGPTRNLTRTQGVREMSPAWSPDGRWIAYLSDATGEYEIYVRPERGEPRQLTRDGSVWRYAPVWSPDSTHLAFGDRARRLWLLEVAGGKLTEVDRGTRRDLDTYCFSPDGRWLAYEQTHPTRLEGIALYSLPQRKRLMLGDGLTTDRNPVFSADGSHLFFLSDREFNLTFSAFEFNYVYTRATRVYAAALDPGTPALFPAKSDEEARGAQDVKAADDEAGDEGEDDEQAEGPARVQLDGWSSRTVALPGIEAGDYRQLSANAGAVFYVRAGENDAPSALLRYDLDERKEAAVLEQVDGYVLSADGKKLLYAADDDWGIVEAEAEQSDESPLDLDDLRVKLEPRLEWSQIYEDAWRIARDWFYDPAMHGKDWAALGERYRALVGHAGSREDLDFILGELISELEAGHTYVEAAGESAVERVDGGLLGCELEADATGDYRLTKIYAGESWNEDYRSPLTDPGVDVRVGEYLLAIDGVRLQAPENPYRLLEGKAGDPVALRVGPRPTFEGSREVRVVPIASEGNLRYLDWVRERLALTDALSGGRIGYIHLPDTSEDGNRMLQKLFYSQVRKPALIIDERYNGGGFIPDRMIEYFARRTLAYWARRDIESFTTPGFAHDGPKAMLINAYSGSGGDALPYFFKLEDLGPVIGTRTWGGLIGLAGNPALVDGGSVLIPSFRLYDRTGRWVVENEGVVPDIEVIDLPELRAQGRDPSLEKAVEVLLQALEREPPAQPPTTPVPPDLSR